MTKQEQIAEIAKIICEKFGTDTCKLDCPCMNTCANNDISERLYNAGYGILFDLKGGGYDEQAKNRIP